MGRRARRLCGREAGGCGLASQAKAQGPGASSAVDPRVRAAPPGADSSPPGWGACPTGARPRLLRLRHLGTCGPGATSVLALACRCERPGLARAPPSLGRPHLVSFDHVDGEQCSAWLRLRAARPLHAVREPQRARRLGRVCARGPDSAALGASLPSTLSRQTQRCWLGRSVAGTAGDTPWLLAIFPEQVIGWFPLWGARPSRA